MEMDGKKLYGIMMSSLGLLFIVGTMIMMGQIATRQDNIILIWGFIFMFLGSLSFFWDKIADFKRQLWLKIIPERNTKVTKKPASNGLVSRLMVKYYQALNQQTQSKMVDQEKPLSRNAQKRLDRANSKNRRKKKSQQRKR